MISFNATERLGERPLIVNPSQMRAKFQSLMSENTLLTRLKPSQVKTKIRRIFEAAIAWIVQFFKVSRPNVFREKILWMIRNGDPKSIPPSKMSFDDLWKHYSQFLNADQHCSPSLKNCLAALQKDESTIRNFQQLQDDNSSKATKEANFIQNSLNEIMKMQDGSSRLLLLKKEGQLFCHVSKHEGKYNLRFIGSGSLMSQFQTEDQVIAQNGKVMREIIFEEIPSVELNQNDRLKKLLEKWIKPEGPNLQEIVEFHTSLNTYRKATDRSKDLISCSDRVDRLFWNVMRSFAKPVKGEPSSSSHLQAKRVKLRANLLTLFSLFQEMRYDLKPHTAEFHLLTQLFETLSSKVWVGHQKGYLSTEDISGLNQELSLIDQALQDAKKRPISLPSKISYKNPTLNGIFLSKLSLKNKQNVAAPTTIGRRTEGLIPTDHPIEIPELRSIPVHSYRDINTKEAFLSNFRDLVDKSMHSATTKDGAEHLWMGQVARLFNEICYHPFVADTKEKDLTSFWWGLTRDEAQEVMQKINKLSAFLKNEQPSISKYNFRAALQMTQIFNFLYASFTGYWIPFFDKDYLSISKDFEGRGYKGNRIYNSIETPLPMYRLDQYTEVADPNDYRINAGTVHDVIFNKFFQKLSLKDFIFFRNRPLTFLRKDGTEITLSGEDLAPLFEQYDLLIEICSRMSADFVPKQKKYSSFYAYQFAGNSTWIRPIQNPYLKALYQLYMTSASHSFRGGNSSIRHRKSIGDDVNSPEAYHSDPEGILQHVLEVAGTIQAGDDLEQESQHKGLPLQIFTEDEIKRLMRLLRYQKPQTELMAFMKESPHLMRNSDVRNFFHALFFGKSFLTLFNRGALGEDLPFLKTISEQLEQEIAQLQTAVENTLREPVVRDVELLQNRFDTLLYYHEMKEKFQEVYTQFLGPIPHFASSKAALLLLRQRCLERKELAGSLGYAARVHLRSLFRSNTAVDMPEIMKNYALIFGGKTNPANIDPSFDTELRRHWYEILKVTEASNPNLKPFLTRFCYERDLPIDESEWHKDGPFIYRNSTYIVNLKTLKISKIHEQAPIETLPRNLTERFKSILGDEEYRAQVYKQENKIVYTFINSKGSHFQIEEEKDSVRLYKKFNDGKWLQHIPKKQITPLSAMEEISKILSSEKSGIKDYFVSAFKILKLLTTSSLSFPFLYECVYADPNDPSSFYSANDGGELVFKLNAKETNEGLTIEGIKDLRSSSQENYQLASCASMDSEALDALALFENKDNILFWHQQGQLKKIELTRYGLHFELQGNKRFVCSTGPLKGYFIDFSATLQEKQGLPHTLLLKHPNSNLPRKLLVAPAHAIQSIEVPVLSKAKGFAKILQLFEIKKILQNPTNDHPSFQLGLKHVIDPNQQNLSFVTVDLRPHTGEICEKNNGSHLLPLVEQALKIDQPRLAWKIMQNLHLSTQNLNQELLNRLYDFFENPISSQSGELSLKMKSCFDLQKALKKQGKLRREIKQLIDKYLIDFGKQWLTRKSGMLEDPQLTASEFIHLAKLFKKKEPDYYNKHVRGLFLGNRALHQHQQRQHPLHQQLRHQHR